MSLAPALTRFEITSGPNYEVIPDEDYLRIARQLGRESLDNMRRVLPPETDPFKEMAGDIKRIIVGQDGAVDSVVESLAGMELRNPNRPVGTYLFLGPTGVGKTELTKALNSFLHPDDESSLLRIDCSDYAHGHNTSRLTGSPPSYAGREQQAILSKENVEGKLKVIMFDEIEKSHVDLRTLLLQILEEGQLTLNNGEVTSFRDTIVIMTSNVGADRMQHELSNKRLGFRRDQANVVDREALNSVVISAAKESFAPEFLNRIDHKVVFHPLDDEMLSKVLESHIEQSNKRYYDKGIVFSATQELRRAFVESADDRREYGARNIVREFDKKVISLLSRYLYTGDIKRGSHVHAYLDEKAQTSDNRAPFDFLTEPHEGAREAYLRTRIKYMPKHLNRLAEDSGYPEEDYSSL